MYYTSNITSGDTVISHPHTLSSYLVSCYHASMSPWIHHNRAHGHHDGDGLTSGVPPQPHQVPVSRQKPPPSWDVSPFSAPKPSWHAKPTSGLGASGGRARTRPSATTPAVLGGDDGSGMTSRRLVALAALGVSLPPRCARQPRRGWCTQAQRTVQRLCKGRGRSAVLARRTKRT